MTPDCAALPRRGVEDLQGGRGFTAVARRVPRLAGLVGEMLVGRYRLARSSDPQPQSSSLALPCQILVSVDGCQSLTAFGSCIHWMPAPSRRPNTPAGTAGKAQGGLPLGNPVCLWQTELFKLNLKSSPSSSGYNRRRRLATRSSGKQQAGRTAVRTAPIVYPEESPQRARWRIPLSCVDTPTPRRGCRGRAESPLQAAGKVNFVVCEPLPGA